MTSGKVAQWCTLTAQVVDTGRHITGTLRTWHATGVRKLKVTRDRRPIIISGDEGRGTTHSCQLRDSQTLLAEPVTSPS